MSAIITGEPGSFERLQATAERLSRDDTRRGLEEMERHLLTVPVARADDRWQIREALAALDEVRETWSVGPGRVQSAAHTLRDAVLLHRLSSRIGDGMEDDAAYKAFAVWLLDLIARATRTLYLAMGDQP